MRVPRSLRSIGASAVVVLAAVAGFIGCELRTPPALITVYNPSLRVSFPLPQGWTADEARQQSGFHMQTFTGRSVDVPDRPGIRVQILAGPMPSDGLDEVAGRFRGELAVEREDPFSLEGHPGKQWLYESEDGEESSRLMLSDVDGMLYGLFVRGEARTLEAYGDAIERMFDEFALEQGAFFPVYEAPGGEIHIKHPRSWNRTHAAAQGGESLFVGFRSTPLAVESEGTTVHATLEVTVNKVGPEATVESFYAQRTELLGDNYRLVRHEPIDEVGAISTLYYVETQHADYLERTVYFVQDGKSFIYKFNARNRVYYAIEPWIDEIVQSFFLDSEVSHGDAD